MRSVIPFDRARYVLEPTSLAGHRLQTEPGRERRGSMAQTGVSPSGI